MLQEVIKAAPNLTDPYKTMGLCYEQTGNSRKALDFYMITAHMAPKVLTPKLKRCPAAAQIHHILGRVPI